MLIPGHNLGNSQVSVNRTIGPTLVHKRNVNIPIQSLDSIESFTYKTPHQNQLNTKTQLKSDNIISGVNTQCFN